MPMRIRIQSKPRERMRKVRYTSANLSQFNPITLRNPDPRRGETGPTMIAEQFGPIVRELTIKFIDGPLALYFNDRVGQEMRVRLDHEKSGNHMDLKMMVTGCTVSLVGSSEVTLTSETFRGQRYPDVWEKEKR